MPSISALMHEDVAVAIFQGVLSLQNISALSKVSRFWRLRVRDAECWAGTEVRLSTLDITEEDLLHWWPAWSKASVVLLRRSQMPLAPPALLSLSAIEHSWGHWPGGAADGWHRISLGGHSFLACMTREESPDVASVIQDVAAGHRFREGVWAGYTTADSPDMLSRLSSQVQDRDMLPFCDVLAVQIFPRTSEELPVPEALYTSSRDAVGAGVYLPHINHLFFDCDEPEMIVSQCDRARRTVEWHVPSGSVSIPFGHLLGQDALAEPSPLRFFVASLCTEGRAPAIRLLPSRPV